MEIEFTKEIKFTKEQVQELFLTENWKSANDPIALMKALEESDLVISAWDQDRLIGLISAISDHSINAFITYLIVEPDYRGQKIGSQLVKRLLYQYRNYNKIILTTTNLNRDFYEKFGFVEESDIAMLRQQWKEK